MKSLIYLVVFFLLFNGSTAKVVDSLSRKHCKENAKIAKPYYYKFCVASIKENPESRRVRNIDELTVVCTSSAISNLTNVRRTVEKILVERKYKNTLIEKVLHDCLRYYSQSYEELTSALKYLKAHDYKNAGVGLTQARFAPRSCEIGFNFDNDKQISPLAKENLVLYDMIDIPLFFNYFAHKN